MKKGKLFWLSLGVTTLLLLTACGKTEVSPSPTPGSGGDQNMSATTLSVKLDSSADGAHEISSLLYGLFIEDINHAIDGGMYAELVKNRSFEYGAEAAGTNLHGWSKTLADAITLTAVNGSADNTWLNSQNPTYAVITNTADTAEGISNSGYLSGMAVKGSSEYICSFYAKSLEGYTGPVYVSIGTSDIVAEGKADSISGEWTKYSITLKTSADAEKTKLNIKINKGSVALDMISLMPADTYKNLPIRKDIGEYLESLNPSFLRFPGGCVIEGKDLSSQYSWKDSIGNGMEFAINGVTTTGDIATRPQSHSIWNGTNSDPYYTTYGIGFYEYFELCEALDCEAVPVLNAGMTCPVQSTKYKVWSTSSAEFKQYVQDALDLVEFCRGGADTKWGAVRIAMGHEEPFALHYIAIGNEQWQSEYYQHYSLFCDAFEAAAKKNPELFKGIELIIANGPTSGDKYAYNYISDAEDDDQEATVKWTGAVDEHYYEAASWFFSNNTRYDKYDRKITAKVFLGEYAAQSNSLRAALAEASYMTALERNSDIVVMSCYAPLFANSKANQWTPDLIWYNSTTLYGTANYYVQRMFAQNVGTVYLPSEVTFAESEEQPLTGMAGLGSWETSVAYDNLVITSNDTGEVLYSNDFESTDAIKDWTKHRGSWSIKDGRLVQSNTGSPKDSSTGDAIYFGDTTWKNYTLSVEGTVISGAEGFLIPVCVQGVTNNIFWNLGGWGNTVSCLQIVSGGSKSGQITGTTSSVKLVPGKTYNIKVCVQGTNIKCYLNDKLYIDYTQESASPLYQSVNLDASGDIILKLVSTCDKTLTVATTLEGFKEADYDLSAYVTTLTGEDLASVNTFSNPTLLSTTESRLSVGANFNIELPKNSVTVVRIKKK